MNNELFRHRFLQATRRVVIFVVKVDDDLMNHGIESQPFPAYSSLYLFDFLSLLTLNNAIVITDFTATVQGRTSYIIR